MARGRTVAGEIEVRVVLQVMVDRDAWATYMLDRNPAEVLDRDIRQDVKRRIYGRVADMAMLDSDVSSKIAVPIGEVRVQGLYDTKEADHG